jgi:hypothetical protein
MFHLLSLIFSGHPLVVDNGGYKITYLHRQIADTGSGFTLTSSPYLLFAYGSNMPGGSR